MLLGQGSLLLDPQTASCLPSGVSHGSRVVYRPQSYHPTLRGIQQHVDSQPGAVPASHEIQSAIQREGTDPTGTSDMLEDCFNACKPTHPLRRGEKMLKAKHLLQA